MGTQRAEEVDLHDSHDDLGHSTDDARIDPVDFETKTPGWPEFRALLVVTIVLICFFLASMVEVYLIHKTQPNVSFSLPTSMEDVRLLRDRLVALSDDDLPLVFIFYCTLYLFKQIFCLPGSGPLNLLAGNLFGLYNGFIIVSFISPIGAMCCYVGTYYVAKPLVLILMARKVEAFRRKMKKHRKNTFFYLLAIRTLPFTPHWLVNVSSPIIGVPSMNFLLSTFLGYIPYNYATVSMGELLYELDNVSDVLTVDVMAQLIYLSLIFVIPAIIGTYLAVGKRKAL